MNGGSLRIVLFGIVVLGLLVGYFFVETHPGYFNNVDYLAALVLLQLVMASLWKYEVVFFPLLMGFFLWGGMDLPYSSAGMTARWLVLVVAASAGFVMWMRLRQHSYNAFHLVAFFCVAAAFVSALVSADPPTSLLKVLSLFLLFLYGATGARLALLGRESKFINGLIIACELAAYASAISYLGLGAAIWGNPNSLGAVMGVVVVPILLWAVIVAETRGQRYRRVAALLIASSLLYVALSRASILAAGVAVVTLCFCLRRQRLLVQGAFLAVLFLATAAVLYTAHFENFVESVTAEVLYKGKGDADIWSSRKSPWQDTLAVVKERPWFGTGFGTSYMGEYASRGSLDLSPSSGGLYTKEGTNREHGNSYLALLEYVGLLGMLPFALLFFLVARMIAQICLWMRANSDPYHCAIPLAMVLMAGLIHAFFEDWLMAVGYYLCLFFWTSAFLLQDVMPAPQPIRLPRASPAHPRVAQPFGTIVPNR